MHILLTGAAGFIGARVAGRLAEEGHSVVALDNLNDAYDVELKRWRLRQLEGLQDFRFHHTDILDRGDLERVWREGPFDAVMNLAARAGVRPSVRDPELFAKTNVMGALNLLELCRRDGVGKFVQASTSSLYGAHNPRPFDETADISRPLSPYAATKGAAEMLAHSYHHLHELDVTVLRFFTVYGPAGRPDMSVFRFVQWIAEGRPLRLYGDGSQQRDFTYVEDIARGTVAALRPLDYEVINLGGDQPVSMRHVIGLLEDLLDKKADVQQEGPAPGDVPATWAKIDRAQELLGWQPQIPLEEGLRRTVSWYLEQRDWASQVDTSDL